LVTTMKKPNYNDIKTFLEILFPDGEVIIESLKCQPYLGPLAISNYHNQVKQIKDYLEQATANNGDIYVVSNKCKGTRSNNNMVSFRNLFADLDVGRDKEGNYYPAEIVEERKKEISDLLKQWIKEEKVPCPTIVGATRNGFQLWWGLREPIEDKVQFELLLRAIAEKLQPLNADFGVCKISSLMRLIGSWWQKKGEGQPPYLTKIIKSFPDKQYTEEELLEYFPIDDDLEQMRGPLANKKKYVNKTFLKDIPEGHYYIQFPGQEVFEVDAHRERNEIRAACQFCDDPKGHHLSLSDGMAYCWVCHKGAFVTDKKEDLYSYQRDEAWKRIKQARRERDMGLLQQGDDKYIQDYLQHKGLSISVEDYITGQGREPCADKKTWEGMANPGIVFKFNHEGNVKRFKYYYPNKYHYLADDKVWAVYHQGKWDECLGAKYIEHDMGQLENIIQMNELPLIEDQEYRRKCWAWINSCGMMRTVTNSIDKATSSFPFTSYRRDYDHNFTLLNCKNGTVDLSTGELLPHSQEHMITKQINIDYNPQAQCPKFEEALLYYMGQDQIRVVFLQRLIGMALLGKPNRKFPIFYGLGRNGKSIVEGILREIFYDYFWKADADLLKKTNNSKHLSIYSMQGKRIVVLSETDEQMVLDTAMVKSITGDSVLTGRGHYKEWSSFTPTALCFLITNHKPKIKDSTFSLWDRLLLINFNNIIPDEKVDENFFDKLKAEYEGILAFFIKGALLFQQEGLNIPHCIKDETLEYRKETGAINQFIDDYCIAEFGYLERANKKSKDDYTTKIPKKELYQHYKRVVGGLKAYAEINFSREINSLGFQTYKSNGTRYWLGINLKELETISAQGDQESSSSEVLTFLGSESTEQYHQDKINSDNNSSEEQENTYGFSL